MKFNNLVPEFDVSDINKSKDFYTNIGFKIMYERPENNFVFLELEGNQIMINGINQNWETGKLEYPFGRGINISMRIKDIEKYYKTLKEKNITFFRKIRTNEYRVNNKIYYDREFLIQDPDGYLLRFNS